jgi:tRNA(Ile)-lysidine synthase
MNQEVFSPMVRLSKKVKLTVQRYNLLSPGNRVLVAVSGGPDSVALLHILYELREELALCLEAAHLQHGIRGEEAKKDARFVRGLAERLNLPVHIKEVNIPRMRSEAGKGNLEALARRERYRFFADVARQRSLNKIATAHTRDDQVETVLMWLLRGAGRKGLGGMAPRQTINVTGAESSKGVTIIRPLLDLTKDEILDFLKHRGCDYRLDRSNEDPAYLRNWIRRVLLPQLKERIDSRVPSRLAHLAEVLRDEETLLNTLAQEELEGMQANGALSRERFLRQPKAMQRRVLRLWIEAARGHLRGLDFDHAEALVRLISDGPPQSRLSIPGGWELIKEYETLRLAKAARRLPPDGYSFSLAIGGEMEVREAGVKILSQRFIDAPSVLPEDHWEAVFDLACLTGPLVVRNFRRGDRLQPFGMAGRKRKVKELFIEHKVPLSARAVWPILVMGDEILWLPGFGRSELGRITPATREFLRLKAIIPDH